jgi:hypothetical protein
MKRSILALAVVTTLGMTACSSTKTAVDVGDKNTAIPAGSQQAISEQRLASEFKRQGVKVVYSMRGELEAIETVGYAPVWGNSQNAAREAFRVAELEAKKSLNDFINKARFTLIRITFLTSSSISTSTPLIFIKFYKILLHTTLRTLTHFFRHIFPFVIVPFPH